MATKKTSPLLSALAISLIIISISIAYYLVIFLPKQANFRQSQELLIQQKKTENYNDCVYTAAATYTGSWNSSCKQRRLGDQCTLPVYQAEVINKTYENDRDRCVTLYK